MFATRLPITTFLLFVLAPFAQCACQETDDNAEALRQSLLEAYYTPFHLGGQTDVVPLPSTTPDIPAATKPLPDRLAEVPGDMPMAPAEQEYFESGGSPGTVALHTAPAAFQPVEPSALTWSRNLTPQEISWWEERVGQPMDGRFHELVTPDGLVELALRNSPVILAVSQEPLIQETEVSIARADFDADLFVRTQYDDRVDPVGNQLTTGGLPFLEDNIWYGETGFRRKLYSGADVEMKQRFGFHNSNSRFFDPQDQGTATLSLNFSQPLMRGRGQCYNRSQIVIAQTGAQVAWDRLSAELQNELTLLVEAYWRLYHARAVLLQKEHNVERGKIILSRLEGRSELDSLPSQIARARAAVVARSTELANARRDVRNAETEIRRILGSSQAFLADAPELVPAESPQLTPNPLDPATVIDDAIRNRPEVHAAIQRARIAAVQQDVSRNEILPELNLIFKTYVSALRGESDVLGAWSDQFSNSTPGYAAGLEFSIPRHRRAERARLTRSQLVVEQVRHEVDQVVHQVAADAQVAWRQVDSAFQTAMAAAEAIEASRADLAQNEARWESFALIEGDLTEGHTPTTLLDQLLEAQQRLTNAELTWSQALLDFKVAEIGLKRATGSLLSCWQGVPADAVAPAETHPDAN